MTIIEHVFDSQHFQRKSPTGNYLPVILGPPGPRRKARLFPQKSRLEDMDESSGWSPWDKLSKAERRVVELLCRGLTNPQIAQELFLSRRTVQSHLYNVFKKVGVQSRTELVALAVRAGVDEQFSSADSRTGA